MSDLKLAKPVIPIYSASGKRVMVGLATFRILRESARMGQVIKRKRDGAITRAYLLAEPNEIATRVTAQAEVVKVLPTTWTHRASVAAGF